MVLNLFKMFKAFIVFTVGDGAAVKKEKRQSPNLYIPSPNANQANTQNIPNIQEVTRKLDGILADGGGRGSITYCPNPQTCITRLGQEESSVNRQSPSGNLDPNQFNFLPSRTPGSQPAQGFGPQPFQGFNQQPFQGFNQQPFQGFNQQPFQGFNQQPFQGFNQQPFQGFNQQPFNFPQIQQPFIPFPSITPFVPQPFPVLDLGAEGKKNGTFNLGNLQGTFYTLGGPGQASSTTIVVGTFGDKGAVKPEPPAPSPTAKPVEETQDLGVVTKEVVVETVEEVVQGTTFPPELKPEPRIASTRAKRAAPKLLQPSLLQGFPDFPSFPGPSFPPFIAPSFQPISVPQFPEIVDNKDGTFSVGNLTGTLESSTIKDKGGKPSGTVIHGTYGDKEHGFGTFVQHVSNGGTSVSSSYSGSFSEEPKKDDEEDTTEEVVVKKKTKSKSKVSKTTSHNKN
jgi:hypothetical protein